MGYAPKLKKNLKSQDEQSDQWKCRKKKISMFPYAPIINMLAKNAENIISGLKLLIISA